MADNCIFCKIAGGEIPAKLAYKDERYIAFHDIHPQAPTHILIIPRAHVETINDLTPQHAEMVGGMILLAQKLAGEQGLSQSGYRLVLNCNEGAGQSVWHIHMHLLGGRPMHWPPG